MDRIALLDGDVFVYRAAWAANKEDEATAIRTFDSIVAEAVLLSGCEEYKFYLTGKGNFRNEYAKTAPYKGNRKAIDPPIHKNALRDHALKAWDAILTVDEEADDAIAIEATKLGLLNSIMITIDKDFIQIPGLHFNPVKKKHMVVDAWSGLFFFYQQILMGDTADNIIGLRGIGPAKAHKILTGSEDELELFNRCVNAYDGDVDRVIENARLLWLRREPGQIWEPPNGR